MTLIEQLKPEYRNTILATRQYVEPPAKTPAHIKALMVASMKAFCENRSLSPVEVRSYQDSATCFQATRPKKQIMPELSSSDIDQRNRARLAGLTAQIELDSIQQRAGISFEAGVEQPGAKLDARPGAVGENCIGGKCSTMWEHQKAAEQHSNLARQAHSLQRAEAHYHAANMHRKSALDNSTENSVNACMASRYAHSVKD
jgi:hypothetical protein